MESLEFDGDLKYIEGKEFARAVKRPVKTEDLRFARIGKGSKEYLGRLIDEQKMTERRCKAWVLVMVAAGLPISAEPEIAAAVLR